MITDFDFSAEWTDVVTDPAAARLRLEIAGQNCFRAENLWSKSIDEAPHLSAGPLALWLAQSWWRLRWELDETKAASHDWRMAHEIAAAGGGFLWPNVTFSSDGDNVRVSCVSTPSNSADMIKYLSDFARTVTGSSFELGVDRFLRLVVERLTGTPEGERLAALWGAVLDERSDPASALYRRTEAMLGYDPDEASPEVVQRFIDSFNAMGQGAGMEIAYACHGASPVAELMKIEDAFQSSRVIKGKITTDLLTDQVADTSKPAETGRLLAHQARAALPLRDYTPVSNVMISDLIGIRVQEFEDRWQSALPNISVSRATKSSQQQILLSGSRIESRRFNAMRLVCDSLIAQDDFWHPATAQYSARQKIQRAFASEFLAPIKDLDLHMNGDFSEDSIEGAAEMFEVSPLLVKSQLANNGRIPAF
jgi:hypothetical protein